MKTIYGLVVTSEDAACMHWFIDKELVDAILNSNIIRYHNNINTPQETFVFPDDFDLEECGFQLLADEYLDEIREELKHPPPLAHPLDYWLNDDGFSDEGYN
jgi:hypothetical protein